MFRLTYKYVFYVTIIGMSWLTRLSPRSLIGINVFLQNSLNCSGDIINSYVSIMYVNAGDTFGYVVDCVIISINILVRMNAVRKTHKAITVCCHSTLVNCTLLQTHSWRCGGIMFNSKHRLSCICPRACQTSLSTIHSCLGHSNVRNCTPGCGSTVPMLYLIIFSGRTCVLHYRTVRQGYTVYI